MNRELNLNDIQGNIVRAYGRFSFPFSRYYFFHFPNAESGRNFIELLQDHITTAARWSNNNDKKDGETEKALTQPKPNCTTNVALTFSGLLTLKTPTRTLMSFPEEFIEGMKARAVLLGDCDQGLTETDMKEKRWDKHWDQIWQDNASETLKEKKDVHILVTLNAQLKQLGSNEAHPALKQRADELLNWAEKSKVIHLKGIGRDGKAGYDSGSAVFEKIGEGLFPTAKEHFGFTDGIGDPCFEGQYPKEKMAEKIIGRGKILGVDDAGETIWAPIATGEFILGHPDESQELPPSAQPSDFMLNGSFLSYRKLHENVDTFEKVVNAEAQRFAKVMNIPIEEAVDTIKAKMCGRWSDGVPLSVVPTYKEWKQVGIDRGFSQDNGEEKNIDMFTKYREYLKSNDVTNFRYADDMSGAKCPLGSHLRRVNPRDYMDPLNSTAGPTGKRSIPNKYAKSSLNKRRRILRRGLPYGPKYGEPKNDNTEQGVIMLVVAASLFRQFEFVQQQWIQYGLDFHQGNNTCPMLGNHKQHKRFTIEGDPETGRPPYVMDKLETFVECRGGDYFFIPSMSALRMLSMGIVDPT